MNAGMQCNDYYDMTSALGVNKRIGESTTCMDKFIVGRTQLWLLMPAYVELNKQGGVRRRSSLIQNSADTYGPCWMEINQSQHTREGKRGKV